MRLILVILILFVFKSVDAQNIVPNGSFEDENLCTEFHQQCSPSGWFYVSQVVRGYAVSNRIAASGDRYLSLVVVDTGRPGRDYWQTMLLCPLEAGKNYKVSLKLASKYIGPNLHDIGLFFSDSLLFVPKDSALRPAGYLSFLDSRIRKLRNGWFQVQKEFTATTASNYLIIGNFSEKTNRQITKERGISIERLSLAVDDLSIVSTKRISCAAMHKTKDSLYSIKERHSRPQLHDSPVVHSRLQSRERIDTIILNNIEFDFDSYQIKNPRTLQYLGSYLPGAGVQKIKIIGFTDSTGSMHYNKSLSEKRAKAVANFLVKTFWLRESIMEIEGKGISTKYTGAQQNRRVEIYIYH